MQYTLPRLAYDYSALEPHISRRALELHHGQHHAAHVANANKTLELIDDARRREDFTRLAALERSLAFNLSGHVRLLTTQIYDHQSNLSQAGVPLLVLDAWEHAYYLQYENRKGEFFEAVWNRWNWDDVAQRLDRARACDLGLPGAGARDPGAKERK